MGDTPIAPITLYVLNFLNGGYGGVTQLQHKDQFVLELDHFALCIQNNKQPKTSGEEGLKDLYYIQKIYESAQKNGQTIKI